MDILPFVKKKTAYSHSRRSTVALSKNIRLLSRKMCAYAWHPTGYESISKEILNTIITLSTLPEERAGGECCCLLTYNFWFDLVRTNRFLDVLNPFLTANYQKTIDANKYLYPIPQPEMNIKPGLYDQNNGY